LRSDRGNVFHPARECGCVGWLWAKALINPFGVPPLFSYTHAPLGFYDLVTMLVALGFALALFRAVFGELPPTYLLVFGVPAVMIGMSVVLQPDRAPRFLRIVAVVLVLATVGGAPVAGRRSNANEA
jgi:hypothetical protein